MMSALHAIPVLCPPPLFFPMKFAPTIRLFSFHPVCIRSSLSGGIFLRYIPPFFSHSSTFGFALRTKTGLFLICGVDWTYDDPTNLLIHRHVDREDAWPFLPPFRLIRQAFERRRCARTELLAAVTARPALVGWSLD